jgi:nucleotide-binding universal stress UspA family protein
VAKTVLITTDGSARSHRIIPHAMGLAKACGARMVFCQVMDPKNDVVQEPGEDRKAAVSRGLQRLEGELRDTRARFGLDGNDLVVEPQPDESLAAAILRGASQVDADVIAIESHGAGMIRSAILGSVAMGVVKAASVPVLVGGPGVEPVPPLGPFKIVATTDGSPGSEAIFRMMAPLVEGANLEVKILRVFMVEAGLTEEEAVAQLRPELERARALLPAGRSWSRRSTTTPT